LLMEGGTMTTIESTCQVIGQTEPRFTLTEDQLAAVAFLARYRGRTLEAYRHDLRVLFEWAAHHDLAVLEATRTHLESHRTSIEDRGLAASTIHRRLSPACGFYRFAHIDGRIPSNPAQHVRPPPFTPPSGGASTAASWPASCSPQNVATTPTPP